MKKNNGKKENKGPKTFTKEDKVRTFSPKKSNQKSENDKQRAAKDDETAKKFPNFMALTKVEKLAFFQVLTIARKNVEKMGISISGVFGTVHDEYLLYFDKNLRGGAFDTVEEFTTQALERNLEQSPSCETFFTKHENPDACRVSISGLTFTYDVISIEKSLDEALIENEVLDPVPLHLEPNLPLEDVYPWNKKPNFLKKSSDNFIEHIEKKKKYEEETWLDEKLDENEFENLDEEDFQLMDINSGWVMMVRPNILTLPHKDKENVKPHGIKKTLESDLSDEIKDTPRFDALNLQEREIFFNILKEAHDGILIKNPDKKQEILPFDTILKKFQKLDEFPLFTKTLKNSKKTDKKMNELKGGKNIKLKLKVTSADNERLNKTKSEIFKSQVAEEKNPTKKNSSIEFLLSPGKSLESDQSFGSIDSKCSQEKLPKKKIKNEEKKLEDTTFKCDDGEGKFQLKKNKKQDIKKDKKGVKFKKKGKGLSNEEKLFKEFEAQEVLEISDTENKEKFLDSNKGEKLFEMNEKQKVVAGEEKKSESQSKKGTSLKVKVDYQGVFNVVERIEEVKIPKEEKREFLLEDLFLVLEKSKVLNKVTQKIEKNEKTNEDIDFDNVEKNKLQSDSESFLSIDDKQVAVNEKTSKTQAFSSEKFGPSNLENKKDLTNTISYAVETNKLMENIKLTAKQKNDEEKKSQEAKETKSQSVQTQKENPKNFLKNEEIAVLQKLEVTEHSFSGPGYNLRKECKESKSLKKVQSQFTQTAEKVESVIETAAVYFPEEDFEKKRFVEDRPNEIKETETVQTEYKTGKVVLVGDDVIEKIQTLIQDLERKAKAEENHLDNEYLQLLLAYIDYLSKVMESLLNQRSKVKDPQIQNAVPAEIHFEFSDEVLLNKNGRKIRTIPRSISEVELNFQSDEESSGTSILKMNRRRGYQKLRSDEKSATSSSSLPLLSGSGKSLEYCETEYFSAPLNAKKKKLSDKIIRSSQDSFKEKLELEEESRSNLSNTDDYFFSNDISMKMKDEEKYLDKMTKQKFFRILAKLCHCGKKKDKTSENLKDDDVSASGGKTKDAVSVTMYESTRRF